MSECVTKSDLAQKLYSDLGFNKRESKAFVDDFFDEIRTVLESNESVKLTLFGHFELQDKKQRAGRNPKTGETIPISARRIVSFKPSQTLKARVATYSK